MANQKGPQDAAKLRRAKLYRLKEAWEKAPATIRVMAGPYIVPMIEVLEAMSQEMDELEALQSGCKGKSLQSGSQGTETPDTGRGRCKFEGCNYPKGACEGECFSASEG